MSQDGINLTTPVGRVVWGHPTTPRKKLHQEGPQKGQPVLKQDGSPVMVTSFGVAFSKADFSGAIWPSMAQEIASVYPNIPSRFAYKYVDGDTNDSKGVPYAQREGYAGCFVLAISTELDPPPIFKLNGGKYDQLPGEAIKCGDYVAVGLNFKCVPAVGTNTPSIYVNPRAVELVGYGVEIISTGNVDAAAVFGGAARQLPPGASPAPVATPGAPGMPGMSAPPAAAPGAMPGAPAPYVPAAVAPPPPPPPMAPPGPVRPTNPAYIQPNPAGGEFWWNGAAWEAAPALPPPAPDFVAAAIGAPPPAPGMPQMPGMPGPR